MNRHITFVKTSVNIVLLRLIFFQTEGNISPLSTTRPSNIISDWYHKTVTCLANQIRLGK